MGVSAATEALRIAGVGRDAELRQQATHPLPRSPPRPGDVRGFMARLRADFQRQYFVTADVDLALYEDNCLFADPTISFRGRDACEPSCGVMGEARGAARQPAHAALPTRARSNRLLHADRRNLQLVVPFLAGPRITLRSLRQLPPAGAATAEGRRAGAVTGAAAFLELFGALGSSSAAGSAAPLVQLQAEWLLETDVRLPWRPRVVLQGRTTYTLNGRRSGICRHVEEWALTPLQALLLLAKPGRRRSG